MPVAHARQASAHPNLVPQIRSISFLATGQRFFFLLREISAEEYRGGGGMLTAVVVHKMGHYKPPAFSILRVGSGSTCRTRTVYGLSRSTRLMTTGGLRVLQDEFKVQCPTGSGRYMTLFEVAQELVRRLAGTFLRDADGRRPVYGGTATFQDDPHWRDLICSTSTSTATTGPASGPVARPAGPA
jgi:hypothetical protein